MSNLACDRENQKSKNAEKAGFRLHRVGQRVCVLAHLIQRLCVLSDGRKERRRRVVAGRSGWK